uniref:Protein kinase domain-containing protein n=1 Tax=Pristionchus pacificus TaxID=54126 RepID=A0A8R1YDG3_PRIPA
MAPGFMKFIGKLFKSIDKKPPPRELNEGEVSAERKAMFGYDNTLGIEPTWSLTVGSQRDKRRLFLARCLSLYYSSFLLDRSLLIDILVEPNDTVLLDPSDETDEDQLELAVRDALGNIEFIRLVPRRFDPPLALTRIYTLAGEISWATLAIDEKRHVPVSVMKFSDLTPKERDYLQWQVQDRRHFGNHRIWRFWGLAMEGEKIAHLVMEDLTLGPVSEFVSACPRSNVELLSIATGMSEACRYLERHNFIHRALCLEAFLLTHDIQVKLSLFCFSPCTLFPLQNEYEDVDHCRWVPWECLPNESGYTGTPYDLVSMVYTHGNCLWSLYHSSLLPFENEIRLRQEIKDQRPSCKTHLQTAQQITCRKYRETASLEISDDCMPDQIASIVRQGCWRSPKHRYTFERILSKLKGEKGHTARESNRSLRSPNTDIQDTERR